MIHATPSAGKSELPCVLINAQDRLIVITLIEIYKERLEEND